MFDPVMAAYVLLGAEYDDFQKARMRAYWFFLEKEDHSGNSTGKTKVIFDYAQLRVMLIPDQWALVYYPTFQTGKDTFWEYYRTTQSRIFRAHLGDLEESDDQSDGRTHGASCYTCRYRNGNKLEMPAPGLLKKEGGQGQVSRRCNTLIIEEYTAIDAAGNAIDNQLKNRNQRPSYNQFHPIWGNHTLYSAPAETQSHPSFQRHDDLWKRWHNHGDPRVQTFGYSFKDWSNRRCATGKSYKDQFWIHAVMDSAKSKSDRATFMGKGLGIWGLSGEGWFTEQMIQRAEREGKSAGLLPMISKN